MLQQMQRQMRGGGMQEMMKAMMRGQGGDQFDMEEMQRTYHPLSAFNPWHVRSTRSFINVYLSCSSRHDVADGQWDGRARRPRGRYAEHVGDVQDDGHGRRRPVIHTDDAPPLWRTGTKTPTDTLK